MYNSIMNRYILDTNIFFNMEEGINLGGKTQEVIQNITAVAKKGAVEIYMPPRVVEEFLTFFDNKEQPFLKNFLASIIVKSPDINKINLHAQIFYQLVEDIRGRSLRGLRVGEEEIGNAGRTMAGKNDLSKKEFEITIGKSVKSFRDRYRQATRVGFLDSVADLDLIMLTQELDGALVTTDAGVIKWGRVFGIKEISPPAFGEQMRSRL